MHNYKPISNNKQFYIKTRKKTYKSIYFAKLKKGKNIGRINRNTLYTKVDLAQF